MISDNAHYMLTHELSEYREQFMKTFDYILYCGDKGKIAEEYYVNDAKKWIYKWRLHLFEECNRLNGGINVFANNYVISIHQNFKNMCVLV